MKVMVTGGAGYIGAHVARALAERGHAPVVLDDLRDSAAARVGSLALERVALEDTPGVVAAFERHRPEAVIHLAGSISVAESVADPAKYWRNNLGGGASLLIACARVPVRTFLFSSTAAVYGDARVSPIPETAPLAPTSPYGASKLAFEKLLHEAASALRFRSAALRYFNAAGANPSWAVGEQHVPEEHLIPRVIAAAAAGEPVHVYGDDYETPDGTCVRDYIHVTDLAEAHVRVVEAESLASGSTFNCGTGRGHSVLEVIRAVAARLGCNLNVERRPRRAGDPASLVADPSALGAAVGWSPSHSSLDEIVASAVDWARSRPAS